MLKSWSIQNFKPIVDSGELKLAPVTVLAGRNSSGKSSLIQSILMIAQTLSNPLPERALLPNERIVQLGTYEDILSKFSESRKITIGFKISGEDYTLSNSLGITAFDPKIWNCDISVTFIGVHPDTINISAIESPTIVLENIYFKFETKYHDPINDEFIENKGVLITVKASEEEVRQFLSDITSEHPLYRSFNSERQIYLGRFFSSPRTLLLVRLFHFLPTNLEQKPKKSNREKLLFYGFSDEEVKDLSQQITHYFTSQIRYLGPLRVDPQSAQKFASSSELDDVGFKGEHSAVVYYYNQLAQINWYNPSSDQVQQGSLQEALDAWANYLDIASQVTTESSGNIGVAWKVVTRKGQQARTLSEVGVGISQILPILVMGLLSPKETLLIIEQPELHLHPRVQARLGDFFMGLAKCGKQCLIETHSENLVSQLRYHIVEAGGQENSDCLIYFVDQDEQGAAKFEQVEISPQGNILNWPDGFFDETMLQEDRITAASLRKRAKKAKNG